jgi:hypothetical protein
MPPTSLHNCSVRKDGDYEMKRATPREKAHRNNLLSLSSTYTVAVDRESIPLDSIK